MLLQLFGKFNIVVILYIFVLQQNSNLSRISDLSVKEIKLDPGLYLNSYAIQQVPFLCPSPPFLFPE